MVDMQPEPPPSHSGAASDRGPAGRERPSHARRRIGIAISIMVAVVALVTMLAVQDGRSALDPGPSSSPAGLAQRSEPRIALIDDKGALAMRDRAGVTRIVAAEAGAAYGFPAWSPDGSRIAAVVDRPDGTSIEVFAVGPGVSQASPPTAPIVAYRSAASRPFYLYWTPDGRRISFLAGETDGISISLRVAAADGSGPAVDDPAGVLRRGAPLYFDWIGSDRLLLHVGTGTTSFVGEVGPDRAAAGPELDGTGDYRPAIADASGRYVAFVRGEAGSARVIAAGRDGSGEHGLAIIGPAAIVFDPTSPTLATIAADRAEQTSLGFPLGPLRLLDPGSGDVRTLLSGDVVGFFWSPDGRTIAAVRLQAPAGSTVADRGSVVTAIRQAAFRGGTAAGPSATPGPTPGSELHLLFVNVADGAIRSDRIVRFTTQFVRQLLPYFDQYALSHRTWAPDSGSIVLPLLDDGGAGHLVILPADGGPVEQIPGSSGFWSP